MTDRRVLAVAASDQFAGTLTAADALRDVTLEQAAGHADALQRLRARDYDVVITDPTTPVTEDLAFAQEVRAARPAARVIVLAPAAEPMDVVRALRAEVFACFTPPVDEDELVAMVRAALDHDDWRSGIEVVSGLANWISLRVSCRMITAERLTRFMAEYRRGDLPSGDRQQLMTAFREILLNAMEHGAGFDPEKVVEVSAARTSRAIVYHFRDPGPGFRREALTHAAISHAGDPTAHLERRAELGLRPGGFGLLLARHLVDEVVYNERGNEVILIRYTDGSGKAPERFD